MDLRSPAPSAWKTMVPEQKDALESVALIGGRIVAQYLVDVQSRLRIYGLDGRDLGEIALPGTGTVAGLAGREDEPEVWYLFSSPLTPSTAYRYDPDSAQSTPFEAAHDARRYEPVRNPGALRHVEGRHARAVFHDREEEPRARRQQPDDALRLRRLLDLRRAHLSFRCAGLAREGWRVGQRRASAAARSTARPGTRPACSRRSRTSSTTSSPWPSIW